MNSRKGRDADTSVEHVNNPRLLKQSRKLVAFQHATPVLSKLAAIAK
jgi:hypothetical protein